MLLLRAVLCCALVCGMVAAVAVVDGGVLWRRLSVAVVWGSAVVLGDVVAGSVSSSLLEPFKPCRGRLRALAAFGTLMECAGRRERANAGSREAHSHRQTPARAAWADSVGRSPEYVGSGGACKLSGCWAVALLSTIAVSAAPPDRTAAAAHAQPSLAAPSLTSLHCCSPYHRSVLIDKPFSRIRFDARWTLFGLRMFHYQHGPAASTLAIAIARAVAVKQHSCTTTVADNT